MAKVLVQLGADGFESTIQAGAHTLRADEPASVGGADTGPSPYEFLLSALGACTAMTLRMYARRKGWDLAGVNVELRHEKIHARDCEDCESKDGFIDQIWRRIELFGDLDDSQRARLLEIADKCPVHKTLTHEVKIRVEA